MNRTLRAALAVAFVGVITFSAISITQTLGKSLRADVTERKIYTLSNGTRNILARLQQPLEIQLFYGKTAATKAPDQIKFFNNYYYFVKALLEEYERAADGMVKLSVVDPRPFSEDEADALRSNLRSFPITEDENFFFGLVLKTQFGVVKSIPFFSPDRQNFVEYDISYLIDTAITRAKRRIGVLSSLPVMGDDASPYMQQMMLAQGQRPKPPWTIIEQLRQQYEVDRVETEIQQVPDNIDILLVVHPKDLHPKTLWAIDQFVLNGGPTIVLIDPYAVVDMPSPQQRMMQEMSSTGSNIEPLLRTWGLEMPADTFAGDLSLALKAAMRQGQPMQKIIGFMELQTSCFNDDRAMTANLNRVRLLFPGVLKKLDLQQPEPAPADGASTGAAEPPAFQRTPLLQTTNRGNTWNAAAFELQMADPSEAMKKFIPGTEPVEMAYMVTGKLPSAFPDGIDVETAADTPGAPADPGNPDAKPEESKTEHLSGLTRAEKDCVVVVFADVDFVSDIVAYERSMFGSTIVGDNSAMLMNAVEDISGSSDLIAIRSRGNYQRPFGVVDEIEAQAEKETAERVSELQAKINGFAQELQTLQASPKQGEEGVLQSATLKKIQDIQVEQRKTQAELRQVNRARLVDIERLGTRLANMNMLLTPAIILIIAILLSIRRGVRRRHYISHASDA